MIYIGSQQLVPEKMTMIVSFSGGRTSAYLVFLALAIAEERGWNVRFIFMDTGGEHLHYLAELSDFEKADVLSWWKGQPFDLQIQEHLGNCVF